MPKISRTYQCQFCQNRFSKPSTLKTHVFSHTGEKPFKCNHPHCDSRFSVVSNLRRHMKIHAREYVNETATVSPQERLRCVKQLIMKVHHHQQQEKQLQRQEQEQQEQYHQQYQQGKNHFIFPKIYYELPQSHDMDKPSLSHIDFPDLFQNFVTFINNKNKV